MCNPVPEINFAKYFYQEFARMINNLSSSIFVSACRHRFRQKAHVFRIDDRDRPKMSVDPQLRPLSSEGQEGEGKEWVKRRRSDSTLGQIQSVLFSSDRIDTMDSFRSEREEFCSDQIWTGDLGPPVIGELCNAIDDGSAVGYGSTRLSTSMTHRYAKRACQSCVSDRPQDHISLSG